MKLKLSWTYYVDYLWYFSTICIINAFVDETETISDIKLGLFILFLSWGWQFKEYIYIYAFGKLYPNEFCEAAISKFKSLDKRCSAVNAGTIISGLYFAYLNHLGVFKMTRMTCMSYGKTLLHASVTQLVFDMQYGTAHWLSHMYWYQPHKAHHSANRDVSSLNMGENELAETVISAMMGTVFPLFCFRYYGMQWEFVGFWLHVVQKLSQHSANPYSPMMFFPPFDYFFKATIAHSIHHSHPKRNFFTIPYHHLVEGHEPDVQFYNSTFRTTIQF